jgi:hypothetical protein
MRRPGRQATRIVNRQDRSKTTPAISNSAERRLVSFHAERNKAAANVAFLGPCSN